MSKSILHLDLHDVAKNGQAIDDALNSIIAEAVRKNVKQVEIIPGKGTGQLMKRVKRFLMQPVIKSQYKQVKVDSKNHGRLFVVFR